MKSLERPYLVVSSYTILQPGCYYFLLPYAEHMPYDYMAGILMTLSRYSPPLNPLICFKSSGLPTCQLYSQLSACGLLLHFASPFSVPIREFICPVDHYFLKSTLSPYRHPNSKCRKHRQKIVNARHQLTKMMIREGPVISNQQARDAFLVFYA